MSPTSTIVSCPGKVLLAGGYLVLDSSHTGFVISTPSRFYTVVTSAPRESDTEDSFTIQVRSPQFLDGSWNFKAKRVEGEWKVERDQSSPSNPFVQLSIASTLLLSSALSSSTSYTSLVLTIVGSNAFYSQSRSDSTPPPFAPLNVTVSNVHKTGLGSSAAMVTSLVSSLFLHWSSPILPSSPLPALSTPPRRPASPDKATLTLIHNLAQYVHSLAQGKVGSGFDVSAAVWGSQVYRRFKIQCLESLLSENLVTLTSKSLLTSLSPFYNDLWTNTSSCAMVSPFFLPPSTTLILADVDAGSNTPSMVGKVLAWKKASPEKASSLWDALKKSNTDLAEVFSTLKRMSNEEPEEYEKEAFELSDKQNQAWEESRYPFKSAVDHILATRRLMREMGELSNVPIEPPEQTRLLDACSALPGVIGAGVPGAGGYDAIWVLVLSPVGNDSIAKEVEKLLVGWTEMSVRPLSKEAWAVGGDEETERGLMREELDEVLGLGAIVKP